MIVLDEEVAESQRMLLRRWRLRVSQIGVDLGAKGIKDDAVVLLLHQLHRPTLFSRDAGFYQRSRVHPDYCIVYLDVRQYEAALFIRRLLQHSEFNTQRKRMGKILRVSHIGVHFWRRHGSEEEFTLWPNA
jgi:hypothetical protein